MRSTVHIPVLVLLALSGPQGMAVEPDLGLSIDDWNIRGSNTVRIEHYDTDGDPSASPYRFDGTQTFDEFHIDMHRRANPWDLWRVQASGLLNHSDYRSRDRGVVPERIAMTRERGDVALPYRVEVGDYFGYFSYRTLQRSLKGAQLELQPGGFGPWRNSVVFLVGEDQSRWKKFHLGDNLSSGASWLAENPEVGSFGLNLVHNLRQSDPSTGALQRSQTVLSAVARTNRNIVGMPIVFEAELAHFTGDHDGLSGAASGQGRSDNGLYLQASSHSRSPLSYRFRYERYGQDFRPSGAVVTADRRTAEAHVGYRFDGGLSLRARLLSFRDALETANPTDTDTHGLTLSGPLLSAYVDGLSTHVDFFHQEIADQNQTINLDTDNLNLELNKRLPRGVTGRLGALLRAVHDDTGGGASATTWELKAGIDAPLERNGWRATFSPELRLRRIHGGTSDGFEVIPRVALAASRGPHRASIDLSYRHQERDPAASTDINTLEVAMRYGYTRGANTFGAELSTFDRNPDPGADTNAYRASLFWTYSFQRAARQPPAAGAALSTRAVTAAVVGRVGTQLLSALAPGISTSEAEQVLARAGFGTHTAVGADIQVYEARLFTDVDQRQRIVIVSHADIVERSALVIDLDATGGSESTEQLFERMRRHLVSEFGRPASFFDRGQFSPALASDLGAGRFLRITEWDLPEGVLRFGIPRRLDGVVRMELQFARGFPEPQRGDWSLDSVR